MRSLLFLRISKPPAVLIKNQMARFHQKVGKLVHLNIKALNNSAKIEFP